MLKRIMSSKPLRMWIDGKPYDIKALTKKQKRFKKEQIQVAETQTVVSVSNVNKEEVIPREEHVLESESASPEKLGSRCDFCGSDDINEHDFNIIFKDGKFSTGFRLPSFYYIKLGSNSARLEELSENTKTVIKFPPNGKDGEITITGDNEANICEARNGMHSVIGEIRGAVSAMQFISMPLLSDEIKDNFEKFKAEVLALDGTTGIEETIFQKSTKLHLTIVVFALLDDAEKAAAIKALEEYKENTLSNIIKSRGPITLKVSGIDCMNDDHKKVNVLYANAQLIEETGDHNLQMLADGLANYFYDKGSSQSSLS